MNIKMAGSTSSSTIKLQLVCKKKKKKKSTIFETQSKYLTDSFEIGLQVNPKGKRVASDKLKKITALRTQKLKGLEQKNEQQDWGSEA